MYTSIVVGTDGSETASIAVQRADGARAAHGRNAAHRVRLSGAESGTHLAGADTPTINLKQVNEDIAVAARDVCSDAARSAKDLDVAVETHTRPGDPADALIAAAKDLDADLVVVGSRGMSGVRRFVLGSVPNKVSHHCPCSLLIVDTSAPAEAGS